MKGMGKPLLAALVLVSIALFFWLDLDRYLSLAELQARQAALTEFVAANRFLAGGSYFLIYVVVTALSIPGAAIMTLAGGAVFGLVAGTLLVSFASSVGATLAFLLARYLLRDYVEGRFERSTERINRGVAREGGYYLFSLRLVPVFPFFVINLAMGLTRLRASTFYWVSQLGMLPGTLVYVNAGTQLARIDETGDILSPALLGSFILLGLFPLLAKKSLELIRNVRKQRPAG